MSFDGFNRYGGYSSAESATVRKQKASASIQKMKKKNPDIEPIIIEGRALAKSWWGKAWNKNLESYSDYRNRIGRGKSYVRSGSVIDLKLQPGQITALVQGSRAKPYEVKIGIDPLSKKNWEEVTARCNHRVDSLQQLVEGSFPEALAGLFTDHRYGLFPSPGFSDYRPLSSGKHKLCIVPFLTVCFTLLQPTGFRTSHLRPDSSGKPCPLVS